MKIIERREFFRMNVNCEIDCYHLEREEVYQARCSNLSATGIAFITNQALTIGEELEVLIRPQHTITPPMRGRISVVWVSTIEEEQLFEIGATMLVLED